MSRSGPREALVWLSAAAIAAAACALVHDHTRRDSASYDEPAHILAAFEQVSRGDGLVNIEHPPLVKEIAGLGLKLFCPGLRDVAGRPEESPNVAGAWFLFSNTYTPDAILAAARAPMLLFFAALLLFTFGAARRLFGTAAGFTALGLLAFDPNFLAHAGVVHTDVPISLFWLVSILAWARVLERRSAARIAACGVVLGLALSTKFSSVYLIPTFALVSIGRRLLERREEPSRGRIVDTGRAVLSDAGAGAAALAIAMGVVLLAYRPAVHGVSEDRLRAHIVRMVGRGDPQFGPARRIASLAAWSRPAAAFTGGLASIWRRDQIGIGPVFFLGRVAFHGFLLYFPVAFCVKSTLPFLLAFIVGFVLLLFRRKDGRDVLLWVPAAYYFFFSLTTNFNLGVRHILPVYPLLAIAGSRMVTDGAARLGNSAWPFAAAVALAGAQFVTALASHPHELSYFNPIAGGSLGGRRILADSNLDWGLDLRRLAGEIRRRGITRPTILYFGGDNVYYRTGVIDFSGDPKVRDGFVAISATLWDVGPEYFASYNRPDLALAVADLIRRLKSRGRFIGSIGESMDLYEIP